MVHKKSITSIVNFEVNYAIVPSCHFDIDFELKVTEERVWANKLANDANGHDNVTPWLVVQVMWKNIELNFLVQVCS